MKNKGFTVIELFMVVMIIGVLATIAIPFYKDYSTRTKVSEGLVLISPFKSMVTEYFMINGKLPSTNNDVYANTTTSNYIRSIQIIETVVVIEYDQSKLPALGENNVLALNPIVENGKVLWNCRGGNVDNDYRPKNCRV